MLVRKVTGHLSAARKTAILRTEFINPRIPCWEEVLSNSNITLTSSINSVVQNNTSSLPNNNLTPNEVEQQPSCLSSLCPIRRDQDLDMVVPVRDQLIKPLFHNIVNVDLARDHGLQTLESAWGLVSCGSGMKSCYLPATKASTTSLNSVSL